MKNFIVIGAMLLFLVLPVFSQAAVVGKAEREKTYAAVKSLLIQGDTYLAIEYLNGLNPPELAGRSYAGLVRDFYWKEKSIQRVLIFGRAGIQYCLDKANELEKSNFEASIKLKSLAKTMAYDLGSFTWPGWDEKGIVLTQSDIAIGLDCALLNLRLAKLLKKPALKVSLAHWLLGAQYLASNDPVKSIEHFAKAESKAVQAGDKLNEIVAKGYAGIAKIAGNVDKIQGEADYQAALSMLAESSDKDAKFFIDQLKTAYGVFVKNEKKGKK